MITISLCMIVKNEEDSLGECLKTIAGIVDEIIIVDTGSADKTKEIAGLFTSNIYDFKWINDFSAARNYSFSKASMEYILWLDADDILLEEDQIKLMNLKANLSHDVDVVMMKYDYSFDTTGNATLSHYRERLLKRSKNYFWRDPVHEWIFLDGNILNSDISITHKKLHIDSSRNLMILHKMAKEGKLTSPRSVFYYAYELQLNGFYEAASVYFNRFLDSGLGSENENIIACNELVKYYNTRKDISNVLKTLYRCFSYDKKRAEVCCNIGYYFKIIGDYEKAIHWFQSATMLEKPINPWIVIFHEYWGYIPYTELSNCYYNLGNFEAANICRNKALEYKECLTRYE